MKHRAIVICQRRWMLLCTFFTLCNIALIGKTEAYTKYRCHFPKFLEVPEGWSVQYTDGSHKAIIEKGKLDAKSCVAQCQEFVRYCQEEKENGKYVVSHEEKDDPRAKYLCMQFIKRSNAVMQIRMSPLSSSDDGICNDTRLMMDDWPLLSVHLFHTTEVKCPFEGGYDFDIKLPSGEKVCTSKMLPFRFESYCVDEEGLLLRIRDKTCTDYIGNLKEENRLRCLATWKHGKDTYVIVRETDVVRYWCMRIIYDDNGMISRIYFFLDMICDTKTIFPTSRKYLVFEMYHRVIRSICSDEFETCSSHNMCNSEHRSHCLESCGDCQIKAFSKFRGLQACTFPKVMHGTWVRHVNQGTSKITISNNTVNINTETNWHCIDAGEGNYSRRRVLMKTFDNGCYPRFMCIELHEAAPSVMRYRVGKIVLWPLNISHLLQEHVCNDNLFAHNSPTLPSQRITPLQNLVRSYDKRTVSCNLPPGLGTWIAFRDEKARRGCLLNDIHFVPHHMFLVMENEEGKHITHAEYFCLASMKFINEYDTIITQTKDQSNEYLCWMIIGNKEFIMLPASLCNRVHAEAVLRRVEKPLARLSLINNSECKRADEEWRQRVIEERNKHDNVEVSKSIATNTRGCLALIAFFMTYLTLH
ncbi:uncharacterized protein LOC106884017 [Octopus bimaculoides]|uniref:Uncharacterized protein n=1 Tax=Octopus bimaculoides TaxID=37653 RepID=A0A0L8I6P4_OCTBM|nr:uncharacterized protein LOC106884017 [Octopus bimaculoides]|eukprot:XP_014790679.1 PREDICTED: uncharacterized protein LOC106884017 [Octopus bimaculoides]